MLFQIHRGVVPYLRVMIRVSGDVHRMHVTLRGKTRTEDFVYGIGNNAGIA